MFRPRAPLAEIDPDNVQLSDLADLNLQRNLLKQMLQTGEPVDEQASKEQMGNMLVEEHQAMESYLAQHGMALPPDVAQRQLLNAVNLLVLSLNAPVGHPQFPQGGVHQQLADIRAEQALSLNAPVGHPQFPQGGVNQRIGQLELSLNAPVGHPQFPEGGVNQRIGQLEGSLNAPVGHPQFPLGGIHHRIGQLEGSLNAPAGAPGFPEGGVHQQLADIRADVGLLTDVAEDLESALNAPVDDPNYPSGGVNQQLGFIRNSFVNLGMNFANPPGAAQAGGRRGGRARPGAG